MIILVLSLFIAGCSAKEASKEVLNQDQKEQQPTISVVVNSTSTTQNDEWKELKAGYELAIVNITVTNSDSKPYQFNPNFVSIQAGGKSISVSSKRPKGQEVLNLSNIEPGKSITGIVCFDIPAGATYDVYYDDLKNKMKLK